MSQLPVKFDYVLKQVKVPPHYEAEMTSLMVGYFEKIADWETRINNLSISGPEDNENMEKAAQGRKLIQQTRLAAVEIIDKARKRIQEEMADTKAADTLWLRIKQAVEADCKTLEAKLKEKEETRQRYEAQIKEQLRVERTALLEPICKDLHLYPLGDMSEGDFQNLYAVLKERYEKEQEAERAMQEVIAAQEKAEREAKEIAQAAAQEAKRQEERTRRLYAAKIPLVEDYFEETGPAGGMMITLGALKELPDHEFESILKEFTALKENNDKRRAILKQEEEQARFLEQRAANRYLWLLDLGMSWDGSTMFWKEEAITWDSIVNLDDTTFLDHFTRLKQLISAPEVLPLPETVPDPVVEKTEEAEEAPAAATALGSVKERIQAWTATFKLPDPPKVTTKDGKKAVKDIQAGFVTFLAYVEEQLEKL